MKPGGPLAGRTIVVTRPRAQCGPLAEAIESAGGRALIFPLLEISPAEDGAPLQAAADRLGEYSVAVFISPNAVDHALPVLLAKRSWPVDLLPAAVGQGTVKALAEKGVQGCIAPTERFDSEALLALPELAPARVAGKRVAIFRGDGGRELLADTLHERGAQVDCITCYRRSGPSAGARELLAAWREGRLDALTVSSSEGLRYLVDLLDAEGRDYLRRTPIFVPHARIAENAKNLDLHNITLTEGADAGLMAGLVAYNWPA
ncbi:uroporphyrinogen-III synthase [Azonexus sp. IMCC34839]|uniref:uroporphyrinogen-III synthase n=1 Tax=Azonexus sp. IMCC34839 TaxID=3133695 RepID=UPI003999501C